LPFDSPISRHNGAEIFMMLQDIQNTTNIGGMPSKLTARNQEITQKSTRLTSRGGVMQDLVLGNPDENQDSERNGGIEEL